ncbi:MAG: hypothetical protein GY777_08200 [Candidatus Brocadiaceae bacterium]|nr:hypothetical protein [Candidatus Brocadiaceae bacterium]
MHDEAVIKSPDFIEDQVTGELREVDISIRKKIGLFPILIIIECKIDSSINDVQWIEQISQKREALKASKAVGVFSNKISDIALKKASFLDIETRLLRNISLDDISGWCKVRYLTQSITRAEFLLIKFRSEESKLDKLEQFTKTNEFKSQINKDLKLFLSIEDKLKYNLNDIWSNILSTKRKEIYQNVKHSDKTRRTIVLNYNNPNSRYQIIVDGTPIDILEITITCDLWIEEKQIPMTVLNKYSSEDNQLFETVGWKIEENGKEYNLNIHRDLKTGQTYISANNISDEKIDIKP